MNYSVINPNCKSVPTVVDNTSGPEPIANLFMNKNPALFQSVPTNDNEMRDLMKAIDAGISYMTAQNIML